RVLQKLYVPRFVSALLVLVLGLLGTGLLAQQLIAPAGEWIQQVPREMPQLAPTLRDLAKPVPAPNDAAANIARAAGGDDGEAKPQVVATRPGTYETLPATPRMIAAVLAVVLLPFFFTVYGQSLQRNAIALLPGRQQKKLTVA